jgi:alpha-1,2-mannosyltransferase
MLMERIRTGDWVTARRLRVYPLIYLGVSLAITLGVVVFSQGVLDPSGKPLGTDFLHFWSASNLLWQGRPEAAYDPTCLAAISQSIVGLDAPHYAWLYPPMALLVVAPLAALPYLPALTAWLGVTLLGYMTALWRILPDRRAILPMVAFSPVFINLGHGQNALLSTALMGWGLILLPRCPWLGGALMGVLIYKPHLGLLVPVALFAVGNWRSFLGAGLAALALTGLSYGLLGAQVWTAFLVNTEFTRLIVEQGLTPWQKMISSFGAARMLGAPVGIAWGLQALVSLTAALAVGWVWRGTASHFVKVAALVVGTLLAAPLVWDYDAVLLSIPLAALVAEGLRRGFLDWEISVLALAWLTPLFWRPLAMVTNIPLAQITLMLLLWVTLRRAARMT